MRRGDLLVFLVSLDDATIAAWHLENEDQNETIASYIGATKQQAVAQGAQAAAAQLQATQVAHAAGKSLIVTFTKGQKVEEVTFNEFPSWRALVRKVEDLFHELEAEEFRVKAGRLELSEQNWPSVAAGESIITLGVVSICRPFSSFRADEAFRVLDTAAQFAEDAVFGTQFSLAEYNPTSPADPVLQTSVNLQTHGVIVAHAGKELALRCCKTNPDRYNKEASKKEIISPVIFAAAALAGDVRVEAEYNVCGTLGKGMIDYVILYKHFSIIGKLHDTLEEHLGQLAAEIRSAREQYKRVYLTKRKHDDEGEFKKVYEAELQASQKQHGTGAAASQEHEQQLPAQIEELQKQNASQRLTAYAAAGEIADLQAYGCNAQMQ
ncbi:uncharacterized protein HaLaN_13685 [Haematococcus lacustris]|uniref:Uncharacterized protein n=1 Tax=Haematococcus lacustris TaxID=44745 RepID=A0A699ZE10_HAELA|nr:uncharacterized protein HaLaN_13685 [Haematococcus lacustris]